MKCIHGVEGDGIVEVRRSNCYACQEEDADLARLREEISEATDACNGLHDMVKDLENENARLRAIAARVEDVDGMAQVMSDTHKYAESMKIFKHSARALRDYLKGGDAE